MTKFVIETAELIKRTYVIDAYTEEAAIEKMKDKYPQNTEVLSDTVFNIHTVNEYEYKKEWKPKQRELFDESNDIWRDD